MRTLHLVVAALLVAALAALAAPAGPALAAPTCHGKAATKYLTVPGTLTGTAGDDVLVGSSGADTIEGLGGDDLICALAGGDVIVDFAGVNVVYGGSGDDHIQVTGKAYGESGNDSVFAVETSGGAHDGYASGGSGNDQAIVSGGVADGGSGSDTLYLKATGDTGLGGSGSDTVFALYGGGANQILDCGSGYDSYQADPTDTVKRCEKEIP